MKRLLLILCTALWAVSAWSQTEAAREVIRRFAPQAKVRLELMKPDGAGGERYEVAVRKGVVEVRATSGVALCRGFYDWVKRNGYGQRSWAGSRIDWPSQLPDAPTISGSTPFAHRYYLNVVSYGYTMPYWDWARWSDEIDWMALHGFDMPLALVANEAISARVWKKLGLTDAQIDHYFVAPAHLPWMRMGNLSGVDSPLPASWHDTQVALQHQILDKMRRLGIKPICPAFAGFVPHEMQELFPEARIIETSWSDGAFRNWFVDPSSALFSKIGTMFIEEWEREFGKNTYYLADSFNEMEVPFPPKGTAERYELLADYGQKLSRSIEAANPDAVWVMQGWMFGYQRDIWEPATLEALCSRVPNDKMLLLDEAVDYNTHFWRNGVNWELYRGFYHKPWVYATIPNMGGKVAPTGVMDFYANGHLQALQSSNRGRLVGYGTAPEGIENNEMIYELISDAAWSVDSIDVGAWLKGYAAQRYGAAPQAVTEAFEGLHRSVYSTFTDHPRCVWQFRPGRVKQGTMHQSDDFFRAIERFAQCELTSPLYQTDLVEWTALYLGGKAERLIRRAHAELAKNDTATARATAERALELLLGLDRLLESHPTLRLDRWIEAARAYDPQFERNARRIVTIWGPPVDDYSARIWSGLVRDYYVPRWKTYFDAVCSGKPFDTQKMAEWERAWVEDQTGVSPCAPYAKPMDEARAWIERTRDI